LENWDPFSALANWRRGELSLRAWMSSLRGVDETAWFARDDLRPFGLMCLRMGWRLAKSPLARARKHARPISATGSAAPRPVLRSC
jgi:D-aspartate ligase